MTPTDNHPLIVSAERRKHIQLDASEIEHLRYKKKLGWRVIADFMKCNIKTVMQIAKITGLHYTNIQRYQNQNVKGEIHIYTEKKKNSDLRNLEKARIESQKIIDEGRHIWQRMYRKK